MKKIIMLGVFTSICIILMSSSASTIEYKTVIEQNTKEILSQETTNNIKTVSDKLTDLIPTMKISLQLIKVLLMLKFIKLIFSVTKNSGMLVKILLLKLLIKVLFNHNTSMIERVGRIFGVILINILKIIRFPFKLISKSITLLVNLIRLIILSSNTGIGINYFPQQI